MQIKLANKTYTIEESIKNTRRAYLYQKNVLELYKNVEAEDEDQEIFNQVANSPKLLDEAISFLVDLIGEDKISAEYFEDHVSLNNLMSVAEKVTKKLIASEGETAGKKSATTKPSEASTSSVES